jgi:hypothetical protein
VYPSSVCGGDGKEELILLVHLDTVPILFRKLQEKDGRPVLVAHGSPENAQLRLRGRNKNDVIDSCDSYRGTSRN